MGEFIYKLTISEDNGSNHEYYYYFLISVYRKFAARQEDLGNPVLTIREMGDALRRGETVQGGDCTVKREIIQDAAE